jgi:hypothetical protein
MVNFIGFPNAEVSCQLCHQAATYPVGHHLCDVFAPIDHDPSLARVKHIFCRSCIAGWFAKPDRRQCPACARYVRNASDFVLQQASGGARVAAYGFQPKPRSRPIDPFMFGDTLEMLQATGNPSSESWPLFSAVAEDRLDKVHAFLAHREISQHDRGVALISAAGHGYLSIVLTLLPNGEITQRDRSLALLRAVRNGHTEIVEVLLESGISPETKEMAVRDANETGHLEILRVLQAP